MSNIKFHSNGYRRFKYDFKDSIVNEGRSNYPIEKKGIGLSVSKGYSLLRNYQKRNKKNSKKSPINVRLLYHFQINIS